MPHIWKPTALVTSYNIYMQYIKTVKIELPYNWMMISLLDNTG